MATKRALPFKTAQRKRFCIRFFPPPPPFLLSSSHLPQGLLFLFSPIFHCHKIKDGGYNNTTNSNKVPPKIRLPCQLHESQQQHYTAYTSFFIHQPQLSLFNSNKPFLFNLQYSGLLRLRDCLRRIKTFLHLVHFQLTSLGTMDGEHS